MSNLKSLFLLCLFFVPSVLRAGEPPLRLPPARFAMVHGEFVVVPLKSSISNLGSVSPGPTQSAAQVLNSIYDAAHGALAIEVVATGSPGSSSTFYNTDQIFNLVLDSTNVALKVNCIAGCTGGGVTSITGDGTLLTNSLSTGGVTLTLGNAGGHTWFGNNTDASAPPAFNPIGIADLPTAVAQKPNSASPLCYASYFGSDSNDGLSWGTAKADIMACYDTLPSGGGTIFVADGGGGTAINACKSTDPAGCGIWIMGSGDPNYASPPAGWRKWKGSVEIIGVAGSCNATGSKQPEVCVSAGEQDQSHPAVWLSGAGWMAIKNLAFSNYFSIAYLGVDSNGSRADTGTPVWDATFDNDSFNSLAGTAGLGPAMTITENSFWDTIQNCNFGTTGKEDAALTSCSWSSGTATCTASALPTSWTGTLNLGIAGVADPSYDGLVSATVTSGTTFTYSLASVVSTSTTGGIASSDQAQAILINPGSGNGVGAITIRDSFFAGGGIRAYGPDTVTVKNIYSESAFAPIFHIIGGCLGDDVRAEDLYIADSATTVAGFRADQSAGCASTNVVSGASVDGPATLAGNTGTVASSTFTLPTVDGQVGVSNNRLFAQTDSARRGFGPVATRFVNLASQTPSTWSTQFNDCPGTLTAGTPVTAPDGTNNAGTVSIGSGVAIACFASFTQTLSAGDWLIAGAWARSDNANGFRNNAAINVSCNHCGLAMVSNYAAPSPGGGGEWDWVWQAAQVQVGYASDVVTFIGQVSPTQPADFFAPVLLYIPAGTITTNEAVETALHLQSFRSDATAGQVSLLPGEQLKADSVTAKTLASTVSTGTAPLTVTSTTPVTNLSIGGNAATATTATTATSLASYTSYSVYGSGNGVGAWITPTGNGQCLMSAASSYGTTTPSFQTCPSGGSTPTFDSTGSGLQQPAGNGTFTYPASTSANFSLTGTAPASSGSAGTASGNIATFTAAAGGATTGTSTTGGAGGGITLTAGAGGSGSGGTNASGGTGGSITLTSGAGGAKSGSGTAGSAGVISLNGLTVSSSGNTLTGPSAGTFLLEAGSGQNMEICPGQNCYISGTSFLVVGGKIGTYNNKSVVGDGIPYMTGDANVAATASTVSGNVLASPVANHAYKLNYYMWQAAGGSGGSCNTPGSATLALTWTDPSTTAQTDTFAAMSLPVTLAAGAYQSGNLNVVTASSAAIAYSITVVQDNCSTHGTVQAQIWAEASN